MDRISMKQDPNITPQHHKFKLTSKARSFTRREFLSTSLKAGTAAFTTSLIPSLNATSNTPYNVLFIMIDDLRPMLGCYGHSEMHTPNIDRLAARGTVFNRAYCNFPLCGPSRSSLLTGLRPNTTAIKDNPSSTEDTLPGITIPQHFKENGYYTHSIGKIVHGGYAWTTNVSWSKANWRLPYESHDYWARPSQWKILDVADDELRDGQTAREAVKELSILKDRPFFLGVGFDKPHVPYRAPRKYYDLYSTHDFSLPKTDSLPKNAPLYALEADPTKYEDNVVLQYIHAYAACTSYVDAQIGLILDQLEKLELNKKTVVVLMGDHGYHLGEHAKWEKGTIFEVGLLTPLIVSMPEQTNIAGTTDALVELVDVFPTLCDACNLSIPEELEGSSMLPLIEEPEQQWKSATFSQVRRRPRQIWYKKQSLADMTGVELTDEDTVDGYSLRSNRYRYSEWGAYNKNGEKFAELATELYDYQNDPNETINVAYLPENAELVSQLHKQLQAGWQATSTELEQTLSLTKNRLPWDIDENGMVDIEDLLLISNSFGSKTIDNPKVDVNKDGNVDIIDLLIVAAHLGESSHTGAPKSISIIAQHLDRVQQWINDAHNIKETSPIYRKGITNLEQLIDSYDPKKTKPNETKLLPNFPNPFNPETWIPYDLGEGADVNIYIHNLKGELIRHLKIGFQAAGSYRSRSRAAHWNGRNSIGEPVSSGIYFYTFKADGKTSTRKMLIMK